MRVEGEREARGEAAVGAAGAEGARHQNRPHFQVHVLISQDELQTRMGQRVYREAGR